MSLWHHEPNNRSLLFECEILNKERDNLISTVIKTDVWTIDKNLLIRKYF